MSPGGPIESIIAPMRCIITAHALRQLTEILPYCLPHLFQTPAHLFEALRYPCAGWPLTRDSALNASSRSSMLIFFL
jgi:hypothetical protein